MALLLTFVILTVALTALFWGAGLLLQAWLYNVPAARLGLRAAAAGAGVALFLTFWCWVDARNPDKYSTLLNFAQYEVEEIDRVDAVRRRAHREANGKWVLDKKEEVTTFTRRPGGRSTADFVDKAGKPWNRSEGDGMVVALRVKEKDKKEPTQFDAQLDRATGGFTPDGPRYVDERGRYIDAGNIGHIIRSRSALVLWNLLLNLLMFAVWLAALWLGLRFAFGHAFGLAFLLWLAMELVLLPILFQQTRPAAAPAAPPAPPATKTAALRVGPTAFVERAPRGACLS